MAYTGMTITQVSGGSITAADTNLTLSGNVTVNHLNAPRRADRHGPGEFERRRHLDERRQLHPSRLGSAWQRERHRQPSLVGHDHRPSRRLRQRQRRQLRLPRPDAECYERGGQRHAHQQQQRRHPGRHDGGRGTNRDHGLRRPAGERHRGHRDAPTPSAASTPTPWPPSPSPAAAAAAQWSPT